MLELLNDGHTTLIEAKKNRHFELVDSLNVQALNQFDWKLLKTKYLDYLANSSESDNSFGKIRILRLFM